MNIPQMIQKAAAMGNWWLAASSPQHTYSCIMFRAEFLGETSNHPGDSVPLQPRFGGLKLLTFPKTKITFEKKRFQTIDGIQENTARQLMVIGRTVWGPKVPTLTGTEVSLSYVQCFLCLLFCILHGWILSGQTSYMHTFIFCSLLTLKFQFIFNIFQFLIYFELLLTL